MDARGASALREACGDADICPFTTVPVVYSEDAAVQWIERQRARAAAGTGIVLAIIPTGKQEPVGMIGLFGIDRPEPIARFGYWLIARARGRGLAIDAARALGQVGLRMSGGRGSPHRLRTNQPGLGAGCRESWGDAHRLAMDASRRR